MKKTTKRILSIMLVVVMTIGAAPLSGLVGLDLPQMGIKTKAATHTYDGFYYTLDENHNATIMAAEHNVIKNGVLIIPSEINGYVVTEIGDYSFSDEDGLTEVSIPDSVTRIGYHAFSYAYDLSHIEIPDSILEIGCGAFYSTAFYSNEENWEDEVLYIGKYLLNAKEDISGKYTIKNGTTVVADNAFMRCENLNEVSMPNSVKTLGSSAFTGCVNLANVRLSDGISSIGENTFYECENIENIIVPYGITKIGELAFGGCLSLDEIIIPDNVTQIDNGAFAGCTSLRKINIPDSVLKIGYNAFEKTAYLEDESNWKNGVLYINNHLVEVNKDLTGTCNVDDGTLTIASSAFEDCKNIESVTLPNSVKVIGDGAFYNCAKLTYINLSNKIEEISPYAFYKCVSLKSIDLPKNLETLGSYAFYYCTSIKNIVLPEGLKEISDGVFGGCTNLESINIPESVTTIIGSDYVGYSFLSNTKIFNNPENWYDDILYVDDCLIYSRNKNEKIEIREGTRLISSSAFVYSSVSEIIIPSSVKYINSSAFYTCDNLKSVLLSKKIERIDKHALGYSQNSVSRSDMGPTYNKIPGFKIYCYSNTEGMNYAIENAFDYEFVNTDNYSVTWKANGGKWADGSMDDIVHDYKVGERIDVISDVPTKDNYIFAGWSPSIPEIMPANDLVFIAIWEKIAESDIYNLGEETYSFRNYADVEEFGHGGHCFGMSVTSSGYHMDILDMMECTGATEGMDVYDLRLTSKVHEPICLFQRIQGYFYLGSIVAGGTYDKTYNEETDTGVIDVEYDWDEVTEYSKNHKYDGMGNLVVGLVGTLTDSKTGEKYRGGHAVNFIRYEEVNGQPRIYVYDSNIPFTETYLYKDSDGNIKQAPYSTFDVSINCVALQDINKYFEIISNFLESQYIYAKNNSVRVEGAKAYLMKGNVETEEMVMYEIPEGVEKVNIIPLKENARIIYLDEEYSFGKIDDDTVGVLTLLSTDDGFGDGNVSGFEIINEPKETPIIIHEIRTPSTTTINYGDSIWLHAEIEGELPANARIIWTPSNNNFEIVEVSADGKSCKITPKSTGNTTFTVSVVAANEKVISTDTQDMNSKAGLWQKIVAFFKKLFGATKTYPEFYRSLF